ncbi:DUF1045 domain-containing protein [Labrys monachus]|uniref:2'-5' RNA ligase n=1 Tax=Labrys monachus TaxID=217067 RepID=A0ABU0FAS4_9HYPH|nr:DUF1045 domain-containing protein [Labrys monachus]MDQ0391719.1 2'-5' RNA ligase [Labrys monachus]
MATRYAIYFVPGADTALWRFGCEILGHDAYTGLDVPQWCPPGHASEAWHVMTADPRLYGFHATLKAPFRLAEDRSEAGLLAALEAFAGGHAPVALGPRAIRPIASSSPNRAFLALVPASPPPALAALEGAIVRHFDAWRSPLTPAEVARRNPGRLNERQRHYLDAHGYPYVLEEFRFHMTLTGAVEGAAALADLLQARAEALDVAPALQLDRLGLFRQDGNQRFRIVAVAPLRGGS